MAALREFLWLVVLPCSRSTELLSRAMDESLPAHLRAAVWRHLLACRPCRCYRDQIRLLRESLARIGDPEPTTPPPGIGLSTEGRERILRALRGEE